VVYNGLLYDAIQGQSHGGLKCVKLSISKSISSVNMYVMKRLTINYDTPRQYLNFDPANI